MEKEYLSWAEKSKISNQKEIYVILRSIMFLKICQGVDRINEQMFQLEMAKLKKKYQLFTSMIPNYDLQKYCEQFSIPQQQIQGAISQIQSKSNKKDQNNKSHFLFVEITSMFIEVGDFSSLNVGQVRFLFERLLNRLDSVKSYLKNNDFSEKTKSLAILVQQYTSSKSINQELAQSQLLELKLIVRSLFDMLAHLTRG